MFDEAYFDQGIDRRGTQCEKWDDPKQVPPGSDVLPMFVADMDFPSPPAVTEALVGRAKHAAYGYTNTADEDFTALANWQRTRHGQEIQSEWALTTTGVVASAKLCVRALTQPGDGVVIQTPAYGHFYDVARAGRRIVENPLLRTADGWRMDFDNLEQCLRQARMLILCNPHNPVGRVFTHEELARVVELCNRYDVILVSDEIHCDFVYSGHRHVPILTLPGAERCIQLVSPTKTFNIASLKRSTMLVPDAASRAALEAEMDMCGMSDSNLFGIVAQRAAYEHGAAWLDGLVSYLEGTRDAICDMFVSELPQAFVAKPEGTYLLWLDMRTLRMEESDLLKLLREQARVSPSGGVWMGEAGRGYIRVNFACPRQWATDAVRRMIGVLKPLMR